MARHGLRSRCILYKKVRVKLNYFLSSRMVHAILHVHLSTFVCENRKFDNYFNFEGIERDDHSRKSTTITAKEHYHIILCFHA